MGKHKWGLGSTSGLSNPQASFWTLRLWCFPGYVTLRKVTGTQAKSENKKNLQAMAMLKLLGKWVLSDSEITFCGYLSERSKWKFPAPWPTLSFRSKSLWAWGIREAQNFKLLSPGERGHQVHAFPITCVPTLLLVIIKTGLKECMSAPVSDGNLEVQRDKVM